MVMVFHGPTKFLAFLMGTAFFHVRHLHVFMDAPKIPRAFVHHLHLDGLGKHVVKDTRLGRVNQHAAIARLRRKTIFHPELVIGIFFFREEMPLRISERYQHPLAHDKAGADLFLVSRGNIGRPAVEVLAVEKVDRFVGRKHAVRKS